MAYFSSLGMTVAEKVTLELEAKKAAELADLRVPGPNRQCPRYEPKYYPKTGWWFFANRIKPGGGECMLPTETRTITDHRDTAETGTLRITTVSRTGTTTGTAKDPIFTECAKAGLPAAECYKLRNAGQSIEQAAATLVQRAQTDAVAAEQLMAAQKSATMKKYLLIGGLAAAGIVAFSLLRKKRG